ncbi:NACHT domain-containing NTPase [Rhizobium ruizarguesonis]
MGSDENETRDAGRRTAGGSATGGGMNFQASVTAIACIYMARGRPLRWLRGIADDTPVAVEAETGGGGDDLRLHLTDGHIVEVQVKKGLKSGVDLWDSLIKLAGGIGSRSFEFGVLAVSDTSSRTISTELATDVVRIGEGRTDNLSEIGRKFLAKLQKAGIDVRNACSKLRIQTLHALFADQASVLAAHAELGHVCEHDKDIGAAWSAIYEDCGTMVEQRGRRDVASVLRLLTANRISVAATSASVPAQLLAKLVKWTLDTHETFSIFGIEKPLSIDDAWIQLEAVVRTETDREGLSIEEALMRYHSWASRPAGLAIRSVNPETLGRFVTKTVLVAGPGMGKTTLLKRIARRYSEDMIPVLRVKLSAVALSMRAGSTFEEAVFRLGLDGSDLDIEEVRKAGLPNWTLLCDGLDECGRLQEDVADGVARFAAGHPDSRVLVTTRPIGYRATHFKDWRHYDLAPLDTWDAHYHAALLIRSIAAPDTNLYRNAWKVARREFERGTSAGAVAGTPLLLGLSVAIVARGKGLALTRERLLEQIFELVDEVPNSRIPDPPSEAVLLRRFLDALGWHMTALPLAPVHDVIARCSSDLVADLGVKPMAAAMQSESFLRYWEHIGMVERVNEGSQEVLTFVHKSFAEFAAARYLRAMPEKTQTAAVRRMIEDPAWEEVLRIASLLGLADLVAAMLLESPAIGRQFHRILRAAELIAEAEPAPRRDLRDSIVKLAFETVLGDRRRNAFDVAEALVGAGRRFPDEVGPIAGSNLKAEHPWSRLVCWAAVVAAGPKFYALDDLIATLAETVALTGPSIGSSLAGGMMLGTGGGHDIAETLAIEACEDIINRAPKEVADNIVPAILNLERFGSVGFLSRAETLIKLKGRNYELESLKRGIGGFRNPEGYYDAHRAMWNTVLAAFDAVPFETHAQGQSVPPVLLHLSAFVAASQMGDVDAGDIWGWMDEFDPAAVREVLSAFVEVVGIDRDCLRRDAGYARSYLQSGGEGSSSTLFGITTSVDPPETNWPILKELHLDIELIEKAVSHPSRWMKWIAANMLQTILESTDLEATVQRLLESGRGQTLWAAAGLGEELDRHRALDLFYKRLEKPLVSGCEHLYSKLGALDPPWSTELAAAIKHGLFARIPRVADSAASLVVVSSAAGRDELLPALEDAYSYWMDNEEKMSPKGGAVPPSPRAKILEAIQRIREFTYVQSRAYLADERSDVRDVGKASMLRRLNGSEGERIQFVADVASGAISAPFLGTAIKEAVPFDGEAAIQIIELLKDDRSKVRYAAMGILTTSYVESDEIHRAATQMTSDVEQQIRDRAFSILDGVGVD